MMMVGMAARVSTTNRPARGNGALLRAGDDRTVLVGHPANTKVLRRGHTATIS